MYRIERLVEKVREGDKLALSRLISFVEDFPEKGPEVKELLRKRGKLRRAYVIGITGSAGSGKSTLIDKLIQEYRKRNRDMKIGVILIDPTIKSGGAFLGDRIRMQRHTLDDHVFIRSMATRGYRGGISPSTSYVIDIMSAYGMGRIVLETIGSGQTDTAVEKIADLTVVVTTPLEGDEIQILKGGQFEIADIVVVNKADRYPGEADQRVMELKEYFELSEREVKVLKVSALTGEGIRELVDEIEGKYTSLVKII